MTTTARLADLILQGKYGMNLYDWAMKQRQGVNPPSWNEVALKLYEATDEEVSVGGQMLRHWLKAIEEERKQGAE